MIRAASSPKDSWNILVNKESECPRCPETVVGDKIYVLGASMIAKKSAAAEAAFVAAMIGPAVWLIEKASIITDMRTMTMVDMLEIWC
jgi:hypothetical protein